MTQTTSRSSKGLLTTWKNSGRFSTRSGPVLNSLTGIHTAAQIDYNLNMDTSVTPHVPSAEWPTTTTSLPSYAPSPLQGMSTANDPHMKDPYTEQWSLTVEHQFTNTTSLRATYTGQHAMKLIYNPNLNQIPFNTEGYGALGPPGGLPGPNFCKYPDGSAMPAGACRPYQSWDYLSSRDNGGRSNTRTSPSRSRGTPTA